MIHTKRVIFVVISVLVVAVIYSPSAAYGLPKDLLGSLCNATGIESENGLVLVECCYDVIVPEGTGGHGPNNELETYCETCEDGGTRGLINCSEPELQFIETPPTPLTPLGPLGIPQDGAVQQPAPTPKSPLGPGPFTPQGEGTIQEPQTTPTPTPEDDQSDDGLGPFRGPLGGGVH